MELRHLRYFVAVADEQHVGRAAARLHVSPSPLSRQLGELERELGVPLLERVGRGIRTSEAGAAFATDARRILADVDAAAAAHKQAITDCETHRKVAKFAMKRLADSAIQAKVAGEKLSWLDGARMVRARMPEIPNHFYDDKLIYGIRVDEPKFPKPSAAQHWAGASFRSPSPSATSGPATPTGAKMRPKSTTTS